MKKPARNVEVKNLWATGQYSQTQLGKMFNVTQCRISAIIHDRFPKYNYCRVCKARLQKGLSVCNSCRRMGLERRQAKKEAKKKAQELLSLQHKIALSMLRELTEIIEIEELEAKQKRRLEMILLNLLRGHLKVEKNYLNIEAEKWRTHPWQQKGRELARFKVRVRDNFTCQDCGLVRTPQEVEEWNSKIPGKGSRKGTIKSLDVHHTGGMCGKKSKRYDSPKDISMLVTLCHKCHYNRHDFSKSLSVTRPLKTS